MENGDGQLRRKRSTPSSGVENHTLQLLPQQESEKLEKPSRLRRKARRESTGNRRVVRFEDEVLARKQSKENAVPKSMDIVLKYGVGLLNKKREGDSLDSSERDEEEDRCFCSITVSGSEHQYTLSVREVGTLWVWDCLTSFPSCLPTQNISIKVYNNKEVQIAGLVDHVTFPVSTLMSATWTTKPMALTTVQGGLVVVSGRVSPDTNADDFDQIRAEYRSASGKPRTTSTEGARPRRRNVGRRSRNRSPPPRPKDTKTTTKALPSSTGEDPTVAAPKQRHKQPQKDTPPTQQPPKQPTKTRKRRSRSKQRSNSTGSAPPPPPPTTSTPSAVASEARRHSVKVFPTNIHLGSFPVSLPKPAAFTRTITVPDSACDSAECSFS